VCKNLLNVKKWDGVGTVGYRETFSGGGVQQTQLRIEGRGNEGSEGGSPTVRDSTQFANE
jgi:hypothetical protein